METIKDINFEKFIDAELDKEGYGMHQITESYLHANLSDIMKFVNDILSEYEKKYPMWHPKPEEWFTNPLDRKFNYSYLITNHRNEIAFLNFTSVYRDLLHNHCTYTGKAFRGKGLAKLHMMKIASRALNDGFDYYEGFWDKHNNGSLILHLKMGFKIQDMRKQEQLYLTGNFNQVLEQTYRLYNKKKN